jgi:hypothetical protein
MSQDQQPIKILGSLIDSNFKVIDPATAVNIPPGAVIDVPSYQGSPLPSLEADFLAMYSLAVPGGFGITKLNLFFSELNKDGNGLPGDIRDFANKYVRFLVDLNVIANDEAIIAAKNKQVVDGFLLAFENHTGFTNSTESSAIQAAFPNLGTYGFGNSDDPDQYQMVNSYWNDFATHYTWQPDGSIASTATTPSIGFFTNLRIFTAVTATITDGYSPLVNGGSGPFASSVPATSAATPSFETIFYQYFPGLSSGDPLFAQSVTAFAKDMIGTHGYFSPSRQLTSWVSYVQNISNTIAPHIATLPPQSVTILNDIFYLIVSMIGSIQNVAASQANRLSLYTSWQKGYTDLLNQVHVFTATSKDLLSDTRFEGLDGAGLTDVQKRRQDEQTNFNAGMIQQITAFKDTVSEDAKALQSRVNQSSDAFNEQANTATAILQEMSTILSAIFR